jgi:hypothetical protein
MVVAVVACMAMLRHSPFRAALLVAAATIWLAVPMEVSADEDAFAGSYEGTFQMSFGTGPNGTNELTFTGDGYASEIEDSALLGQSLLQPISPLCMAIVEDSITLTAMDDDGDELLIVASGVDCLDFSDPNQLRIVGDGTIQFVGGSGDFDDATGSGTFEVVADVNALGPAGGTGTFVLTFEGDLDDDGDDDDDGGGDDDDDGGGDDDDDQGCGDDDDGNGHGSSDDDDGNGHGSSDDDDGNGHGSSDDDD